MKNWKTLAGLFALLLALGGLATWDEWKTKKEETEKTESNKLTTTKLEDVEALAYDMAASEEGGPEAKPAVSMKLAKQEGKWQIVSPINWAAEQQAVDDLVKAVLDYKYESKVSTVKADWPKYGLDKPRRRLALTLKGGKEEIFFIGNNAPVGYSTYIASSKGDDVYAGSQYIGASTGKTMQDLREKKVLSLASSDVASVKIEKDKAPLVELVKKDGKFSITQPEQAAADALTVTNLIDDVTGVKATEFVDQPSKLDEAAFTRSKAAAIITLIDSKGTAHPITFANLKNGFYAAVDPSKAIFKLSDDTKGKVLKTFADLKDKKLFKFQSAQIFEVNIDGKIYKKVKDEWHTADDASKFDKEGKFSGKANEKPTSKNNIRSLLVDLEFAKAEETLASTSETAKKLPANPKHKIVLLGDHGSKVDIDVWLAGDNPEKVYVKTTGRDEVFKTARTVISSLSEQTAIMPGGSELEAPKG
jgi:hypothetical protein